MKSLLKIINWMIGLMGPFIFSFIIIIVIGSILSLSDVSIALISKKLIDDAISGNISGAIKVSLIFVGVIVMQIVFNSIISILSSKLKELISNSIRSKIFEKVLRAQWMELSKYHSGDLLTRMTRDVGILSNTLVSVIPDMISLGVQLIGAFIILMVYEPRLAFIALLFGPTGVLISRIFGKKLKKVQTRIQETEGNYRSFLHETVQNLPVIKSFCMENRNIKQIGMLQNENLGWVKKRSIISAAVNSVLSLCYWMGYLITFGWGAFSLSKGNVSFGTFTAFLQLVGQVQGPFIGLVHKIPQVVSLGASADRLMEFEKLQIEDENNSAPIWNTAGIIFENVQFEYDNNNIVLKDILLEIYPGEIVALIGSSGEGKTTIIRLILSLIYPEKGRIYFTNKKGEKIKCCPSCRELVSYVPQGNTLFSGTIRENLYLGDSDAGENELIRALKGASAWEFIEELPDGLDTVIGENGLGLSEGQAQRIAIARALLRKAPILILDEATSALDLETEVKVLEAIRGLELQRTCVIITHRASVMKLCDRLLKLDDGNIVECEEEFILNPTSEAV